MALANRAVIALELTAEALTRQADAMEADVEVDVEAADPDITLITRANSFVHGCGHRLNDILTTSMAEFEKAKALRQLVEILENIDLALEDERREA